MNKLIKEEINRIREVMGLKLLKESIVPAGSLKKLLADLIPTEFNEALDTIGRAATDDDKLNEVFNFYFDKLLKNNNPSVKNFVDSLNEVGRSKGFSSDAGGILLDDLINGKLAADVEEDVIARMAAKSVGIDANLINYLPSDIKQLYTLIKQPVNTYTNKPIDGLVNSFKLNQEDFNKAVSLNSDITEMINKLPESKFQSELSKVWENEVKYFDDVVKKMKGGADEADFSNAISNLADEYGISTDVVPKEKLNTIGKNLDGGIRKYVLARGVKGNPDDIVKEIRSKLILQMDEKFKKGLGFDNQKLIDEAEKMFEDPKMLESIKQKMIEAADKTLVPVYKWSEWGYWKNFIRGYTPSTGKLKGTTRGEQIISWYINTTKFAFFAALAEVVWNAALDPEQLAGKEGDIADKILDRIGGWGPLLQAFSPFGAGRLLSFFYGVGDYDSLIVYPAQMSEYLKQTSDIDVKPDDLQIIPNTPEYDGTTYEKETVSLVKNKVNGDVYGLFTYDDKTNKVVDVQTIKDNRPPAPSITSGTMTKEQAKAAILAQGYTEPITFIPDSDGQTSYEFVDADGLDGTATLNNGNIIVE
jgi:hypothetical protein